VGLESSSCHRRQGPASMVCHQLGHGVEGAHTHLLMAARLPPPPVLHVANEIRLLASLSHPNVVRQHEAIVAGNKLNIVMEFCNGGDLSGFIKARDSHGQCAGSRQH